MATDQSSEDEEEIQNIHCFSSFSEVENFIKQHELSSCTKYIRSKKDKWFGQEERIDASLMLQCAIRFQDPENVLPPIPCDGIPSIIIGKLVFDCHQGKDRHEKDKKKKAAEMNLQGDHDYRRKKKMVQVSKKINCPAKIRIRHIVRFPTFKVSNLDKRKERDKTSLLIKQQLRKGPIENIEHVYLLSLADIKDHQCQSSVNRECALLTQPLDSEIRKYIQKMVVQHTITNTTEMKLLVEIYVKQTLFKDEPVPSRLNRRYWPTNKDIKNHIAIALLRLRNTNCDQFATVYKAKDLETGNIVAVKKIKVGTREEAADGINRTALREIKLLQELKHKHIIGLQDVFGQRSNVSLVFDFMDTDLEIIIKDNTIVLTPGHIKSYILQTLQGLEYLHHHWILHRDLKPNNLLINAEGILKLGDFGLAKFFGSPSRIYTNQVVTRWYRCPELLFGARQYGTGVDMWAVGCILAELLLRVAFLPGDSDLDQLSRIFQTLGTPTDEVWANMKDLPDYVKFKSFPGYDLKDVFIAATDDLLQLIKKLLAMDPLKRCSATEALKMDYFSNKPPPTPGHLLPRGGKIPETKPNLKRKFQGQDSGGGLIKRLQF